MTHFRISSAWAGRTRCRPTRIEILTYGTTCIIVQLHHDGKLAVTGLVSDPVVDVVLVSAVEGGHQPLERVADHGEGERGLGHPTADRQAGLGCLA